MTLLSYVWSGLVHHSYGVRLRNLLGDILSIPTGQTAPWRCSQKCAHAACMASGTLVPLIADTYACMHTAAKTVLTQILNAAWLQYKRLSQVVSYVAVCFDGDLC
ncbi:hypothetical protein ABBQ38_002043 [Trebouxia sp. C0009 RCD-2024]